MQIEQKAAAEREGTISEETYFVATHSALLRAGGMNLWGILPLDRSPLTRTDLLTSTINRGEAGRKPGWGGAGYVTGICKEVYIRC